MAPRKAKVLKEEVQFQLINQVPDGEIVFGVAHIYVSFNDTFVHITVLSGRETTACFIKVKADSSGCGLKVQDTGISALHCSALRALDRSYLYHPARLAGRAVIVCRQQSVQMEHG